MVTQKQQKFFDKLVWLAFFIVLTARRGFANPTFGSNDVLNTVSGREVPLSALLDFIPTSAKEPALENTLFELFGQTRLRGTTLDEDLSDVLVTEYLPSKDEPTVYIDGQQTALGSKVKIHKGPIFTAVIDATDDSVLQIWSDQLNLVPIGSDYPGIFVNSVPSSPGNHSAYRIATPRSENDHDSGARPLIAHLPAFPDVGESTHGNTTHRDDVGVINNVVERQKKPTSCSKLYPRKILEIAVAFDHKFCERYGGDARKAVSALRALTQSASEPYERSTCIKLKLVHVDGFCKPENDPYILLRSISDIENVLTRFKIYWFKNRKYVHRDIAVYFTGWNDGTGVLGIAYLGFACTQFGYALVELANRHVYAHEVGHLLDCRHTNGGIMKSFYKKLKSFKFSDYSVGEMVNFMDNKKFISACLQSNGFKPTPTPKPPSRTCKNGFSNTRVLLCNKIEIAKLPATSGKVIVSVRIENNIVQVQMKTTNRLTRIWYVVSFISLRNNLNVQQTGKMFAFEKNGIHIVRQKWSMNDLYMPNGASTCCGITYYLYAWAVTCNILDCVDEFVIKPFKLSCANLCKSKPATYVVPMSPKNKCPMCKKKQ